MQYKIDKLTDIIKTIKNKRQANYALTLLSDIVTIINNQENEIKSLMALKTNNSKNDLDNELHKYVLLLILYGYSQSFINTIRTETLLFIAKNKSKFDIFNASEIKLIDLMIMNYELDNDKLPANYNDFKNYFDATKG